MYSIANILVIKFLLAYDWRCHEFGVGKERRRFYYCEGKKEWLKLMHIRDHAGISAVEIPHKKFVQRKTSLNMQFKTSPLHRMAQFPKF
jgi:hypothetical protein